MRAYLDMDGVLVDFLGGVHKALGVSEYSYDNYPYELGKWGMLTDIKRSFCGGKFSFDNINRRCDVDFWRNLSWTPEGRQILREVLRAFTDVYLLTTPMPNPGSWTGKAMWVERNIPSLSDKLIVTSASKSTFADSDSILIDDRDLNIAEFVSAGGCGLLVPRPWNERHSLADTTLNLVKEGIAILKERAQ